MCCRRAESWSPSMTRYGWRKRTCDKTETRLDGSGPKAPNLPCSTWLRGGRVGGIASAEFPFLSSHSALGRRGHGAGSARHEEPDVDARPVKGVSSKKRKRSSYSQELASRACSVALSIIWTCYPFLSKSEVKSTNRTSRRRRTPSRPTTFQ